MMVRTSLLVAPMLFAFACSSAPEDSDLGQDGDPSVSRLAGTYDVTSNYNLSNSPDVPDLVADALQPLTGLSEDPTGTLIDVLDGSGNGFGDLFNSLPSSVRNLVKSQINGFIENSGAGAQITDLVASAAQLVTDFDVITELRVGTDDAAGNANANHTLVAVSFTQDGEPIVVPAPDVLSTLSIARDVSVHLDPSLNLVSFGDHGFELPLGEFAVIAFDQAVGQQFGVSGLDGALASIVDCQGLAAEVGDVCVLGKCLITEAQTQAFCEQGLDKVAETVRDQIRRLEFANLHMMGGEGEAQMAASVVGQVVGKWDAELSINGGGVDVPSTFEAVRRGASEPGPL